MTWARSAYQWLVWLFLLALGLQFFFAGLGVMGGESIDPHRGLGSLLILVSLLLLVLAFVAKLGGPTIGKTAALFVLNVLQMLWSLEDLDPMWLRSFHVLGAFLIAGLTDHLAREVRFPLASRA